MTQQEHPQHDSPHFHTEGQYQSRRKLLTELLGAVLILAIGAFLYFRMTKGPDEAPRTAPPSTGRLVDTLVVRNGNIRATLRVQGTVVAYEKIEIYAEVGGTMLPTTPPFKVGNRFAKDAPLVLIDEREARLALAAQKAGLLNLITQMMPDLKVDLPESYERWKNYLDAFDPEAPIRPFPEAVGQREKYFVAARNLYSQYYTIQSAEERLAKYRIGAPFAGLLTEALISPGAVVRAGQKLGALMNTNSYELQASVPNSELAYVQVGSRVRLRSTGSAGEWQGQVRRIGEVVDPATQSVIVYIGVAGNGLREGMFLYGEADSRQYEGVVRLPRKLLIGEQQVYAVRDSALQRLPVEVLQTDESTVLVKGLADGTVLLADNLPGAYEGLRVALPQGPAKSE